MRKLLFLVAILLWSGPAAADDLQRPVLQFQKIEQYSAGGKDWVRYRLEVANRASYDPALFVPSPALPPCGTNTKASRTWVDIFKPGGQGQSGQRIYGFCALGGPNDLAQLWFAVEAGEEPPRWVYIEMTDRLTNSTVRSNLAHIP